MRRPLLFITACAVLACREDDEPVTSSNGKFEFEEGPPGAVVGLQAIVMTDAGEIVSNEIEVALQTTEQVAMRALREDGSRAPTSGARAHVYDVRHGPAEQSSRPRALIDLTAPSRADAACPNAGVPAASIPTIDGRTCWLSKTISVGSLGIEQAKEDKLLFAADGIYRMVGRGQNLFVPPSLAKVGWSTGVGCIASPDGATISKDYLGALSSLAISFGIGVFSAGYTAFLLPGQGFQRGIQYDSGYGLSLDLLPFPLGLGVSITDTSETLSGLDPVSGYDTACLVPVVRFSEDEAIAFRSGHGNPFATIADGLEQMASSSGDEYRDALKVDMAASMAPLFRTLSEPTGAGPAEHITAATNADLFAHFFAREGTDLCADCPNTSIDGLLAGYAERIEAAGDDTAQIVDASAWAAVEHTRSMPQLLLQSALSVKAGVGAEIAEALADDALGMDDPNRYVARDIVRVEGKVGEELDLSITAEEIAELVGLTVEQVEGATVSVGAEPRIGTGMVVVESGVAAAGYTPERAEELLFTVQVDLSTAAGPFEEDVSNWEVRPALRRVHIEAGPPTQALLSAAPSIASGGPLTLTVMLLDASGNFVEAAHPVRFVDAQRETIATLESDAGFATHQFVAEPTAPVLEEAKAVTISYGDGSTGPGYEIVGSGLSKEAIVRIGGKPLADPGTAWVVFSSQSILIAAELIEPGEHRVEVENPGGLKAGGITLTAS